MATADYQKIMIYLYNYRYHYQVSLNSKNWKLTIPLNWDSYLELYISKFVKTNKIWTSICFF